MDVRRGTSWPFVITLVLMDITAQTVPGYVHLTVNLIHVDTQTENVLVLRVGRVTIVPQIVCCHMEKIVGIQVVYTVSTRRVTNSTVAVCIVVNMVGNVTQMLKTM